MGFKAVGILLTLSPSSQQNAAQHATVQPAPLTSRTCPPLNEESPTVADEDGTEDVGHLQVVKVMATPPPTSPPRPPCHRTPPEANTAQGCPPNCPRPSRRGVASLVVTNCSSSVSGLSTRWTARLLTSRRGSRNLCPR